MGWADVGRLLSLVQCLRVVSSELQVISLTAHPLRFDPTRIDPAVDLDPPGDESPISAESSADRPAGRRSSARKIMVAPRA